MKFIFALPSTFHLRAFWLGVVLLGIYELFVVDWESPVEGAVGFIVSIFCLLPTYLWCSSRVTGLPVFPAMALTYQFAFAMPLMNQQAPVNRYDTGAQIEAGLTVAFFLGTATWIWLQIVRRPRRPPGTFLALPIQVHAYTSLLGLMFCALYQLNQLQGWLPIPGGINSILRAGVNAFSSVAVGMLFAQIGRRELNVDQGLAVMVVFVGYLFLSTLDLLLFDTIGLVVIAIIGYSMTSGRLPYVAISIVFLVFSILHMGKREMRDRYDPAKTSQAEHVSIGRYPSFFAEWVETGLSQLSTRMSRPEGGNEHTTNLMERLSLLQMLLVVQEKSPDPLPYLEGKTYKSIPQLLVPRIINPKKGQVQASYDTLGVYYGLQSPHNVDQVDLSFGLLTEAYANYGYLGVLFLAALIGGFLGVVTQWSQHVPITSISGLFGLLLIATVSIQVGWTLASCVTSLFQQTVVLLGSALLVMKKETLFSLPRLGTRPLRNRAEA